MAKIGRPLSFDHGAALQSAMNLFWEKGYDSVGIAELEMATGLNRSSLYNTFGSKDVLFAMALERYCQTLGAAMLAGLAAGKAGLSDIKRFLDQLAAHLKVQKGRGCFMVNTMALSNPNAETAALASRYIAGFLEAVRAALRRAVLLKEIDGAEAERAAHILLAAALGANLLARAGQPQETIVALLRAALPKRKPTRTGGATKD